jgi:hypothetical protein
VAGGRREQVSAFAEPMAGRAEQVVPLSRFPERKVSRDQIEGLDIPTFIRRQMD